MKTVYLAGSMVGRTHEEMIGWRNEAKMGFANNGISTLDPCRRTPYHEMNGSSLGKAKFVFHSDLADIDNSSLILADVRVSSGKAAGTNMELMYAWTKRIPIVLWVDPDDYSHPFYECMCLSKCSSLKEAIFSSIDFLNQ